MNLVTPHLVLLALCSVVLVGCERTPPEEPPAAAPEVLAEQPADAESADEAPAPSEPEPTASSPSDELFAFLEAEYKHIILDRSPEQQTYLGIKTNYGEWDDVSHEHAKETLALQRASVRNMRQRFDREALDTQGKLSFDLYIEQLKQAEADYEFWDYDYLFDQMYGRQSRAPAFLIAQHTVADESDAVAYVQRLERFGAMLDQHTEIAARRFVRGIHPPAFVYEHVLRDAHNVITGSPFDDGPDSALLADLKSKLSGVELEESRHQVLMATGITALLQSVKPAYDRLITEMQAQHAKAGDDDGAWKLPLGEDYYAYRLAKMTTTDMAADTIHQTGLVEVARIHAEMRRIMETVEFEGTLSEFFTFMQQDPQFYFSDDEAGRSAYLQLATGIIETMKGRLDELFLTKPKAEVQVKAVEAFRERSAGKAFYQRPTPDGSRPAIYYANLYNMAEMPRYQAEALAYHEGVPGHHMQIAIAQELEGVPSFRRYGSYTAYIEGWGLYSEMLPKEIGLYQDPYSDFGRLTLELWRAARLVVDTGLHHKQWTRQQAIDYLTANTPNVERDCVKAIERYIVMPGQATAYKIGMLKILELRKLAQASLGDRFDLRGFHDVVLSNGAVPLSTLESLVRDWIVVQAQAESSSIGEIIQELAPASGQDNPS